MGKLVPATRQREPFRSPNRALLPIEVTRRETGEVSRQGALSRASQSFEFSNDSGTSDWAKAIIESDIKHRTI
jgi:hypothetical protein